MKKQPEPFSCMEDCIHLKACRRVQAIGRKHRLLVPRYCSADCSAYVSGEVIVNYTSLESAELYHRYGEESSWYALGGTALKEVLKDAEKPLEDKA